MDYKIAKKVEQHIRWLLSWGGAKGHQGDFTNINLTKFNSNYWYLTSAILDNTVFKLNAAPELLLVEDIAPLNCIFVLEINDAVCTD